MASQSSKRSRSREPKGAKTPSNRGDKLLVDAQRTSKVTSRQRLVEGRPSEGRPKGPTLPPREGRDKRQRRSHVSLDSRTYSKFVASRKHRGSPNRADSGMDLYETLNAKRNRDVGCSTRPELKEAVPRYQTPFSQNIKGMDPSEKFTLPRFTLYDGKSDLRSHICHGRQMMALWNHMDALICRVFPSSSGDLGLKWFDRLPTRSIESFYQLIESFVARRPEERVGSKLRVDPRARLVRPPQSRLSDLKEFQALSGRQSNLPKICSDKTRLPISHRNLQLGCSCG
ncbi:hypothetical protein Acr_29g0003110 [Actinidia rufa]|uniref:Uncharacterized protein n=1 Tax=Actinidia rufa TaxID=165716 RepID=A0A7J0HDJ6_9ERIC|nr:hypothetical protein Acr_29g0003110 [Actinidia rufa]